MVIGELLACGKAHHQPVRTVENPALTAGEGDGIAFAVEGEGFILCVIAYEAYRHSRSDKGQRLIQLEPRHLRGRGQLSGNILRQKGDPVAEIRFHKAGTSCQVSYTGIISWRIGSDKRVFKGQQKLRRIRQQTRRV